MLPTEVKVMAKLKDRMQALFPVLATGDSAEIRSEATKLLDEIQEDIARLTREAKLIRELVARYGGSKDSMTSTERSEKVRQAAIALARSGKSEVTVHEVIEYLADREGVVFAVKRPASMAGSILAQMEQFERVAMGRFKYIGAGEG